MQLIDIHIRLPYRTPIFCNMFNMIIKFLDAANKFPIYLNIKEYENVRSSVQLLHAADCRVHTFPIEECSRVHASERRGIRRIRSNLMETLSSGLDVAQSTPVMIEFARFSRTSGVENADLRFLRASPFFSCIPSPLSHVCFHSVTKTLLRRADRVSPLRSRVRRLF